MTILTTEKFTVHCATSKMLTLPFFMLESWDFHHRPLACSFSKYSAQNFQIDFWPLCNIRNVNFAILHAKRLEFSPQTPCFLYVKTQWSNFFKLTFDLFWPLCSMKNANFAIFHDRKLKFSPQTPCLFKIKIQLSNFFKLTFDHFWPLCNIKNANFAISNARKLKFSPQTPYPLYLKKTVQWSNIFSNGQNLIWQNLKLWPPHDCLNWTCIKRIKMQTLSFFMLESWNLINLINFGRRRHLRYYAVPTASLSLPKLQSWTPIVDF